MEEKKYFPEPKGEVPDMGLIWKCGLIHNLFIERENKRKIMPEYLSDSFQKQKNLIGYYEVPNCN